MSKVSIIIPSYNHASFIETAVRSALNQSWEDLELIIVDDGSEDDTLKILSEIEDPRMRVFAQDNEGAHSAINKGLAVASGEFLGILNSDDVYEVERLSTLIPILQKDKNIGLIGSYLRVIDESGKSIAIKEAYFSLEPWTLQHPERSFRAENDFQAALLTENYFATTSNFLFRRDVWEQVGNFRPLRYTHDWDFALRVSTITEIETVPVPLARYRVHPGNTIRENRAALIFEICWIIATHLPVAASENWFNVKPLSKRVDQLLHSIFSYGYTQVLVVMLLQKLYENREIALELLEPENRIRQKYMDYILQNSETEKVLLP